MLIINIKYKNNGNDVVLVLALSNILINVFLWLKTLVCAFATIYGTSNTNIK